MTAFDKKQSISWNGQNQPYSNTFGDHFYSTGDGRAETQHVFLAGNDLPLRWITEPGFTIAELGFGTGLNFLETWNTWRRTRLPGQSLQFVSFEAFPLDRAAITRAISSWPDLVDLSKTLLTHWPSLNRTPTAWPLDAQTRLTIFKSDALSSLKDWNGIADAWYLDGFAPSKNPDMWSSELMQGVFHHTKSGGTFSTYTAAGWVRRNLEEAGFKVTKKPGYARKRHMVTGIREPMV